MDFGRPLGRVLTVSGMEGEVQDLFRRWEFLESFLNIFEVVVAHGNDQKRVIGEDPSAPLQALNREAAPTFAGCLTDLIGRICCYCKYSIDLSNFMLCSPGALGACSELMVLPLSIAWVSGELGGTIGHKRGEEKWWSFTELAEWHLVAFSPSVGVVFPLFGWLAGVFVDAWAVSGESVTNVARFLPGSGEVGVLEGAGQSEIAGLKTGEFGIGMQVSVDVRVPIGVAIAILKLVERLLRADGVQRGVERSLLVGFKYVRPASEIGKTITAIILSV
jgi:hypothetical protein